MQDQTTEEIAKWLEDDEANSRPCRAQRLEKVLGAFRISNEGIGFYGGVASAQAFTEIRLAYIHGLYLSTVLLALSCVEQELAGLLHIQGMDKATTARLEKLLEESFARRLITEMEFETFNRLREVRNAYTHYRCSSHEKAWVRRAIDANTSLEDVLESDATGAIAVLGAFLERNALQIFAASRQP